MGACVRKYCGNCVATTYTTVVSKRGTRCSTVKGDDYVRHAQRDYGLENELAVLREDIPQLQEQRLGTLRGDRVVVLDNVTTESQ